MGLLELEYQSQEQLVEQFNNRAKNVHWDRMFSVYKFLKDDVNPNNFRMDEYSNFAIDTSQPQDNEWCQTAGCIAGWAWTYEHRDEIKAMVPDLIIEFQANPDYAGLVDAEPYLADTANYHRDAQNFLGLNHDQANELFTLEPWHSNVWYRYRKQLELAHYDDDGYLVQNKIEFRHITKGHAEHMLLKLLTGEWTFCSDNPDWEEDDNDD